MNRKERMATATKKSSAKKRAPKSELSDVELVRQSAANPSASRAGTENVLQTDDSPLTVTVIDGARAVLHLDEHGPLSQAELQSTVKLLNQAIQGTY